MGKFHQRSNAPLGDARREAGVLFKASHDTLIVKAADDADASEAGRISGYGSKFGLVDSYNETIKKGAFRASLSEWKKRKKPIPMLWQHYSDQPIGGWDTFKEDDTGLHLEGFLMLELPEAQRALAAIKRDVVTGLSIGYMEIDADPWWDPEREGAREVRKLDLREVSVVTFPALREAQLDAVKARVARGERPTLREFQKWLQRELGLSGSEASEVAAGGYKNWIGREAGPQATREGLTSFEADLQSARDHFATPLNL